MQKLVFINGAGYQIDLTSIADNFGIVNWQGLSNTDLNIQSQQVPFEDGGVFLDALMEQREIELTIAIYDGNDLELRYQKKRELISALNPKAGEGVLIYTNDYLSKQIKAVPHIPLFENKNSNDAGTLKASIAFTCCDPYWEDLEETQVYLNGGEQSNIINNDGDGFVGAKIDIFATEAENIMISNLQENKSIKINGTKTGVLTINTEFGKKSIVQRENAFYETKSISNNMYDICYAEDKNIFCACESGGVNVSYNGEDWSFVRIGKTFYGVCYSKKLKLFCAVGRMGTIFTSSDCLNWSLKRTLTDYLDLYSVVYSEEKEMFVAVGDEILTSTDGDVWTVRESSMHPNVLTDICYSDKLNLFVAVGMNNTVGKSADAITWTFTSGASLMENFSVAYSESLELFCLASYAGTVKTSADGDTWNSVTIPISSNWYRVRFCNNMFIAVGRNGTIAISENGILWKSTSVSSTSTYVTQVNLKGVCYAKNQGVFFSVGENGGIARSINGSRWDYITKNISVFSYFSDIAYSKSKGLYVAVGNNGHILTSIDKKEWLYYIFNSNRDFGKIVFSEKEGCFIAIVYTTNLSYNYIMTSIDGTNWTTRFSTTTVMWGLCYSEKLGLLCVCGDNGKVWTSNDLTTFTEQTTNVSAYLRDVIFENDIFIVCGLSSTIIKSIDGVNWEDVSITSDNYSFEAIKYIKPFNSYLLAGNGIVCYSQDFEEWQINTSLSNNIKTIEYYAEEGEIIIAGTRIYKSYDLINWNEDTSLGTTIKMAKVILDTLWLCGNSALLASSVLGKEENIISSLDSNSNMALGLEIGNNKLLITSDSGSVRGVITYRKKYIGV